MAEFNYVVINSTGERITGRKNAERREDVFNYLVSKGFTVVSLSEAFTLDLSVLTSSDIGGIPLKEKVVLIKQLSTMISAGIPIIQALDLLVQQTDKPSLKLKLTNIYKAIESGSSLTDAFGKESGLLSEVQISLLAAGEKSGNLSKILERIADDMEKSKNLRGKILGAMIYPAVIFVVMIVVIIVLIVFMVPQVKGLYESFGDVELPLPTKILIWLSEFFTQGSSVIFLAVMAVGGFIGYRYANSTPKGRRAFDKLRLKIPVFGNLARKLEITQFCRLMNMLLTSGISILDAIEIVSKAMSNRMFSDVLKSAKEDIIKGANLSLAMAKHNEPWIYPVVLIKIISVGEESGKMEQVLADMAKFYEAEVEQITGNLTKLIEPFIMVIAGGLVMFLALAIYTPTLQLVQNIK